MMQKKSFGFLIILRRMKRINIHEHSGGLVCQGLDLSWLNVMTCLLARDSIYPGWMSCRACLPGNRFFQVECHAGFACQGIDFSRLNVMPGSLARDSIYPGWMSCRAWPGIFLSSFNLWDLQQFFLRPLSDYITPSGFWSLWSYLRL